MIVSASIILVQKIEFLIDKHPISHIGGTATSLDLITVPLVYWDGDSGSSVDVPSSMYLLLSIAFIHFIPFTLSRLRHGVRAFLYAHIYTHICLINCGFF